MLSLISLRVKGLTCVIKYSQTGYLNWSGSPQAIGMGQFQSRYSNDMLLYTLAWAACWVRLDPSVAIHLVPVATSSGTKW